ncbi:WD40-repeat-containing domain protein [Spinellus fusiger]|nr:WD40-repeat-containing domain protein [Spinellus fusiger]
MAMENTLETLNVGLNEEDSIYSTHQHTEGEDSEENSEEEEDSEDSEEAVNSTSIPTATEQTLTTSYPWRKVTSLLPFLSGKEKSQPTSSASSSLHTMDCTQSTVPDTSSTPHQDPNEDFTCPICHDIMKEVFMTICGHSYCHGCIIEHIHRQPDCPLCRTRVTKQNIFPNFQLNKLTEQRARSQAASRTEIGSLLMTSMSGRHNIHQTLSEKIAREMSKEDIASLFTQILKHKRRMETDHAYVQKVLAKTFLTKLKESNETIIEEMKSQLCCIEKDIASVELDSCSEAGDAMNTTENNKAQCIDTVGIKRKHTSSDDPPKPLNASSNPMQHLAITQKKQRVEERFSYLKDVYTKTCTNDRTPECFEEFSSLLYQVTRYSKFRVLDSLQYANIRNNSSCIVSSIEFDRDDEYFAMGGVTREIKIYDFTMMDNGEGPISQETVDILEQGDVDRLPSNSSSMHLSQNGHSGGFVGKQRPSVIMHCPVKILLCGSKISCLSWNPYVKSQIVSSDYEGVINVWDSITGQSTRAFTEHKRRVWSVDVCATSPLLIASGSDDTTVKIWSTQSRQSVSTLTLHGNVCCAKFAPNNDFYLAVGSADNTLSCYDLRFPSKPCNVYEGHTKAVSYVRWANDHELVSASTDSTLKLWHRDLPVSTNTYSGHQNEKNFVGLSLNQDWIACGSENNTLYAYYKGSTEPVASYTFPKSDPLTGHSTASESSDTFVSSVCWKKNTSKILAANSNGAIKLLSLEQ